jgi:rhamnose transport system substrate-binding protein
MSPLKKRVGAVAALGISLALVATGCGSSSSGSGGGSSSGGKISVTFLPKNLGNPYFDTSDKGGASAVTAFGGTYKQVGPQTASPSAQVSFINTAAQQGTKALVISANDPTALCSAIKQAQTAGTKVVTFDSDTGPGCRNLFVNQATATGIAQVEVDEMAKAIGGSGDVAILSAAANATNQNAWIKIMKSYMASKYPKMKLVATVYGNDDDQTSFDKTSSLLQTYPTLKGIISPTTVGIAAAARYVDSSKYKGKVFVTGLGTPNAMRKFVNDGSVKSFALWNPGDLGYLAAYAAKALVDGTITGKQGDTFTAGKLGKFTVGADNTVLLGKPYVFTKANIANFNF